MASTAKTLLGFVLIIASFFPLFHTHGTRSRRNVFGNLVKLHKSNDARQNTKDESIQIASDRLGVYSRSSSAYT